MPLKTLDSLPDDARLWSFGCSRPLEAEEEAAFLSRLDGFLDAWHAHGQPLDVARDWRDGCLLLVAVDERTAPPSGCSIDALVRALKSEGEQLGVQLVDNSVLWFRGSTGLPQRITRSGFADAVATGAIDGRTTVFDFTKIRLGDLREGQWEVPAGESWHAGAFRLEASGV
jgi:hypothetical protein